MKIPGRTLLPPHRTVTAGVKRGTNLKKGITLVGVLVAMLAITSGAFAAHHYLITSSSQIKDGVVSLADLSPAARQALQGQKR